MEYFLFRVARLSVEDSIHGSIQTKILSPLVHVVLYAYNTGRNRKNWEDGAFPHGRSKMTNAVE